MNRMTKNGNSRKGLATSPLIDCSGTEFLGDREGQEDYFLAEVAKNGDGVLAILADGMGGHASGEVASQKAVEVFNKTFNEYPADSINAKLGAALQQANSEIANAINGDHSLDGMGCTLVGLHVGSDGLRWISVGDSPLFLFRGGKLMQINADHSMAPVIEESLRKGKISKEEAVNHPHRNALRSAVMGGELTLIDTPSIPVGLLSGDILILASDGIMTLSMPEIQSVVKAAQARSAKELCASLIDSVKAKRRPRQDNTTAIVIKIPLAMGASSGPSKILRLLALIAVLGFLAAFGSYAYQQLNLKALVGMLEKKTTSPVIKEPEPVPIPAEVKEPEPTVAEVRPIQSKGQAFQSTEKQKGASESQAKGTKSKSSNAKSEGAKEKSVPSKSVDSGDQSPNSPSDAGVQSAPSTSKPIVAPEPNAAKTPAEIKPTAGAPITDHSAPTPDSAVK